MNALIDIWKNGYNAIFPVPIGEEPISAELNGFVFPKELILQIFYSLNFADLLTCSCVNKKEWRPLANQPLLLKNVIYREKTINPLHWNTFFESHISNSSENKLAFDSLPDIIGQLFKDKCPTFPGKKLGETHLVVWIPAGISMEDYEALLQSPKIKDIYQLIETRKPDSWMKKTEVGEWILMPTKAIPDSRKNDFPTQINLVDQLPKGSFKRCTVSTVFQATIAISLLYFKEKIQIFKEDDCHIRCLDGLIEGRRLTLTSQIPLSESYKAGLRIEGIYIVDRMPYALVGVAAVRTFS